MKHITFTLEEMIQIKESFLKDYYKEHKKVIEAKIKRFGRSYNTPFGSMNNGCLQTFNSKECFTKKCERTPHKAGSSTFVMKV